MPSTAGDASARVARVKATSLDAARVEAASLLGAPAAQVVLNVLEHRRTGLFGLGGDEYVVEARWQPSHATPGVAPKDPTSQASAAAPPAGSSPAHLTCKRGRISLTVTRPGPGQSAATRKGVDRLLDGLPLAARDGDAIDAVVRAADGTPRIVATVSAVAASPSTDPYALHVSADAMRAWLVPWEAGPVPEGWVRGALAGAGITTGIDDAAVDSSGPSVVDLPVLVAAGRPAVDGVDAAVSFVVPRDAPPGQATHDDDARVDHREVKAFGVAATEGQAVATRIAPVAAVDGVTVRGSVVPGTPGKDFDLQKVAGKGVRLSDDASSLVAMAHGSASWVADRLTVAPLTQVSGDVNYATGNVRVEGDLTIAGTVGTGFVVEASGNVAVMGAVEGAKVRAGGNVAINGGFIGQDVGTIDAGGSVTARFVEAGTIRAGGDVVIAAEARLSTILSDGAVVVGGGRGAGRITGGLTRGRVRVEANEIGADNGTLTRVQSGWGRELDADDLPPVGAPRVIARMGAHPGVSITVGGAVAQIKSPTAGGFWRDHDGKVVFVPSVPGKR